MKVSLNTVKQFIDFELPPVGELLEVINTKLGAVEEIIDLGERYKDARVVKVVQAEQHPNADRLRVCLVDDGGVVPDVPRDENGYVQVVCGAPNAREGIYAVWLPPRSTVPASYSEKERFVLDARELRGVLSQGMLAAADELAIGSDHDGIVELAERDLHAGLELAPGASFAELFGLNDTIIDIENKMFTHRPDLFGQLGVAREIAGILGHTFTSPDWYASAGVDTLDLAPQAADTLDLVVFNDAGENVPRALFVAMSGVTIAPSPLWLQCALVAMGSKAINNVVDATNYLMLLTAQPTHAYDYDKLRGKTIGARMARGGERVTLLNGKTYELTAEDIVIADGEGPIGLAGIMGGGDSEVDEQTTSIVLEVATFDMYGVRKSSMRHGVFTDALTRFNKGQSPLQNGVVLKHLSAMVGRLAGAERASDVFDAQSAVRQQPHVALAPQFINDRLGVSLSLGEITQLLQNVELDVTSENDTSQATEGSAEDPALVVASPFWRTDLKLPEDIVEEVGRLYGYDKLPRELPLRSSAPVPENALRSLKRQVRAALVGAGANEVLTYSFVHETVLKKAGQEPSEAFRLSNALSPDLQYYRLSVLPSLIDKVHANQKAGHGEFALFEIGKAHNKKHHAADDEGLPSEIECVDVVYASSEPKDGAPYFRVRRIADELARSLGVTFTYRAIDEPHDYSVTAPFDQTRSALVYAGETFVGMVGELRAEVRRNFKLPDYSAAASFDTQALVAVAVAATSSYRPLSKYQTIERDICFQVAATTPYSAVVAALEAVLVDDEKTAYNTAPHDFYQKEAGETKNVTLRITVQPQQATLTSEQADELVQAAARTAAETLGATIV